ncbi:MAG: hypothetical protein K6C95_08805 [Lachnospiraceae bacterium]|nr:hypothetical protein [Lachnospiraceae bacterium]
MALKKTWFSYFVWGVFVAFLAASVTMFWFMSGILPGELRVSLSAGLSILTMLAVCLITFALGRFVTYLRERMEPDPKVVDIFEFITAGVLFLCSFISRISFLSKHINEINDSSGLYEEAMIVADGESELEDLLSILTTRIVGLFLRIAGNRIIVAAVVMAVLQTLMVLCFYIAVRLITGRVAAITVAVITGFTPVGYIRLLVVQNQVLFFLLFAVELLLIAIYMHLSGTGICEKWFWIPFFVVVGAAMGFMAYVDLATVILWIPLLATLLMPRPQIWRELVRLAIIFAGFLVMFGIMIIQEDGVSSFGDTLTSIFEIYFQNTNTVKLFYLPLNNYPFYITLVTFMSVVLVTFWRDRERDLTSLWLVLFLVAALVVPFFGLTRLNDQDLLTFCYAAVLGAGLTCLATPDVEKIRKDAEAQDAMHEYPYPEQQMIPGQPISGIPGQQIQGLPGQQVQGLPGQPIHGIPGQQIQGLPGQQVQGLPGQQMQGIPGQQISGLPGRQQIPQFTQAAPMPEIVDLDRVPEGMVLPQGDGSDDGISRMRMPEQTVAAPLGIDRGQEVTTMNNDGSKQGTPEVQLTKDAQKALARAAKLKAKEEAKAAKLAAKEAKKAEKILKKHMKNGGDPETVAALTGAAGAAAGTAGAALGAAGTAAGAAMGAAGTAMGAAGAAAGTAGAALGAAGTAAGAAMGAAGAAPMGAAAQIPSPAGTGAVTVPNIQPNTAPAQNGADDFDFAVGGDDDFDI